ncbi:hypothetical protein TSA6c_00385 [Azospirillum sp. TSA6c]|uniref:hypothetical protein n=1 Tax=Azospirillum sp. TSA6c TaxID=709813 RepID=UPI000D60A8E3|nr:hypothetical protein [Azospirillum sp. TSA6c]PWC54360.1 hypothetical protein TSA6c_00385 [Azospirillum sp. TSA6c]
MNEQNFPTIADAAAVLADLVKGGYGALPVQIIVVPDTTIQALARAAGDAGNKPALMLEYGGGERLPVCLITASRLPGAPVTAPSH